MLSQLKRIYKSVSFIPSLISFLFGCFAVALILFPKPINQFPSLDYIRVKDPRNVQFILSFVIGGIFTLTIFSFTMVMTALNRSISTYSPRLLPLLLSQKNHQIILGISTGTIVYCVILSLFVGNDQPEAFPSLGAFYAILFSIVCILFFIYFIHGVTQSVHINRILARSFRHIKGNLATFSAIDKNLFELDTVETTNSYGLKKCGYLQKFEINRLGKIAKKYEIQIKVNKTMGSFVLENEPLFSTSREIDDKLKDKILSNFSIDKSEPMQVPLVGLKHMVEVAVKACSPGINDPATAVMAIDYLTQLLIQRAGLKNFNAYSLDNKHSIYFSLVPLNRFVSYAYFEMLTFMKNDALMVKKLKWSLAKVRSASETSFPSDSEIFEKNFD
jgi:uncharacterized membrane protein